MKSLSEDQARAILREAVQAALNGHPESWRETIEGALSAALPALEAEWEKRLLSDEGLIAAVEAHGGSVIPHEEATMRDALEAALSATKTEEGR